MVWSLVKEEVLSVYVIFAHPSEDNWVLLDSEVVDLIKKVNIIRLNLSEGYLKLKFHHNLLIWVLSFT